VLAVKDLMQQKDTIADKRKETLWIKHNGENL